jgi:predicted restriction endonuclease
MRKCSLSEIGFRFHGEPIGLEAAYIIPVSDRGTSIDIRNGILLCRNHHILFDSYLWNAQNHNDDVQNNVRTNI